MRGAAEARLDWEERFAGDFFADFFTAGRLTGFLAPDFFAPDFFAPAFLAPRDALFFPLRAEERLAPPLLPRDVFLLDAMFERS